MGAMRGRLGKNVGTALVLALALSGCTVIDQVREGVDGLNRTSGTQLALDELAGAVRGLPGIAEVEVDAHVFAVPPTAQLRVELESGASSDEWTAAAGLVADAAADRLADLSIELRQSAPDLRIDTPVDDVDIVAEVEFATSIRDTVAPGFRVVLSGYGDGATRTIGAIDRLDATTTRALAAHGEAARLSVAAAPERATHWQLPGITFSGDLPSDAVLAVIAQNTLPLPPNELPGDEPQLAADGSILGMPDESIWFGYYSDGTGETLNVGAIVLQADAPAEATIWPEYLDLVRTASATVDGMFVVNVMWKDGGGVLSRTECADGTSPTSTPSDALLADSFAAAGLPLAGFIRGFCSA